MMTPERWQQVERLFHAVLARDIQDRTAFLTEACAGDEALLQEVESLLAQEAPAGGFLDGPALHAAARALAGADDAVSPTLSPGARVGPYEILTLIGAGGMGEVYKARDTRLGRTVAVKVLPAALAADPDRLRRFEQEARAVAALNHSNICTIYDIGSHGGVNFLVMEYLDGQTLSERLAKGPLQVEQALKIGAEIADALGRAHRQGIIHRDLKPGNVMLTKSGAKLLDFGLAKLKAPAVSREAALSGALSPELCVTRKGTILGTLAYMAPEQVHGQEADARSDIFAFGAVLYEMLTGKRAFDGESQASVIAAILDREPAPLAALQSPAAPALEHLVKRCLQKSPDDRWDSAHDVADELRWIAQSTTPASQVNSKARVRPLRGYGWIAGGAVLIAMLLSGIVLGWLARSRAPLTTGVVTRTLVDVRPAEELNAGGYSPAVRVLVSGGSRTALALSPDGRALAFVGRRAGIQQLYVRMLDRNEALPLAGTKDAQNPVFSADGQWVAFWAGGALWKVPINGDPAIPICRGVTQPPYGITWGTTGRLFYSAERVLWEVPAGGGTPVQITKTSPGEPNHILPHLLPGDTTVLYTIRKNLGNWGQDQLVAQSLVTGERTELLRDASDAQYVASGHLVFLRRGVLQAVVFDLKHVTVVSSPVAVLDRVAHAVYSASTYDMTGAGQFSVASTGTLAYISGDIAHPMTKSIVEIDRSGRVTTLPAPQRDYCAYVRVAPDGSRFATVVSSSDEDRGIWIFDAVRHTLSRHPASGEILYYAVWSPDGQRLAAGRRRDGRGELFCQNADGSGPEHVLYSSDAVLMPGSWSADGRHLAFTVDEQDIWVVDPDDATLKPRALIATHAIEDQAEFSPDGRWLAYVSDDSGGEQVYVQPFPGPGPRKQMSVDGGTAPAWNPTGRELFYATPLEPARDRHMMMVVDVKTTPELSLGTPRPLFEINRPGVTGPNIRCQPVRCYDVMPNGQQFLAIQLPPGGPVLPPPVTHINLVQNWFEELKAKVPLGR